MRWCENNSRGSMHISFKLNILSFAVISRPCSICISVSSNSLSPLPRIIFHKQISLTSPGPEPYVNRQIEKNPRGACCSGPWWIYWDYLATATKCGTDQRAHVRRLNANACSCVFSVYTTRNERDYQLKGRNGREKSKTIGGWRKTTETAGKVERDGGCE